MLERNRVASIIEELENAAPEDEAKAVLWEGDDVVELARLIGNRQALYRIAASILQATLEPGTPVEATRVFTRHSTYILSGIVERDDPDSEREREAHQESNAGNWTLGVGCLILVVLCLIGLVSVISWVLSVW